MTEHKHLKQLVRTRMGKTGESYTTARRQIIRQVAQPSDSTGTPHHFPGSIPAAAALRALLSQAGIRNPRTGAPLSEAMVFGIAGGIGAGVFAFYYAKEDFSSFFIAGRHLWQDDLGWTRGALTRFGLIPVVKESAGVKPAERQLRELLQTGRPVMAWLDAAGLPHRAMPAKFGGGAYHVVTIHAIDDAGATALVGDLADDPVAVPLPDLAQARSRIKKFKNRVLAVDRAPGSPDLGPLVRRGIGACIDALTTCRMKNFRLDAFAHWAEQLDGSKAAESWERMFPPGHRLYQGLWSITEYIEHYGTGGGLSRPMFAEFLEEAGTALSNPALTAIGRNTPSWDGGGPRWPKRHCRPGCPRWRKRGRCWPAAPNIEPKAPEAPRRSRPAGRRWTNRLPASSTSFRSMPRRAPRSVATSSSGCSRFMPEKSRRSTC